MLKEDKDVIYWWFLVWYIIGVIFLICVYSKDGDILVEDLLPIAFQSLLGPILLIYTWVITNEKRVIIKRRGGNYV